jgi:hypothetical protein
MAKQTNKWTSGYYSSGYKSPSKTSYSNSSFWLDEDFLAKDNTLSVKEKATVNVVKLAAYKRAIGNFVRIVTNKDNIKVMYSSGRDSYTDGEQVVISAKLDEKEFDSTVGLALHEGSHIALTDFKLTREKLRVSGDYLCTLARWHSKLFPEQEIDSWALTGLIKDVVNIIEDRRIDHFVYTSAPGYQGYYKSLYDKYFNDAAIDKALLEGSKCAQTWDDYIFHICNFANPNRQLDALPVLRAVWNLIDLKNISRLQSTSDVFDVAELVFKEICIDIGGVGEAKRDENKDEEDENGEDSSRNDSGGDDGADINEGIDTNDEMGGGAGDPNMDIQGSNSSSDDGDADENEGDVDPKAAAKKAKEQKELNEAIKKQKDFLDNNIKKKSLSGADAKKVKAAAESNMTLESVGGDIPNATKGQGSTNCTVVKGITKTIIDSNLLGGQCEVPERIRTNLTKYGKDYVADGIILGTLLGKRLKTRDEERSLKTSRLETGRIDRRLVAELGFGNDHVFSQTIHNTVTPSLIHISVDASGSMHGKKWEQSMKTAVAIAKAGSMIKSIDVVISIRGSMGYDNCGPLMWVIYDSRKEKFESFRHKAYAAQASGSTPEGLCFQAIMKEIIDSAKGKDMYFINISDGEPGFSDNNIHYGGDYAIEHTKAQVDKMRANGIKILSYFVSEGSAYVNSTSGRRFKTMYGKDAAVIDLDNLTQLSLSLNKLFERNV